MQTSAYARILGNLLSAAVCFMVVGLPYSSSSGSQTANGKPWLFLPSTKSETQSCIMDLFLALHPEFLPQPGF
jgi:hypothetical protein